VKPWRIVSRSTAPDGGPLLLSERDGEFVIRIGGSWLMSSRSHGSERAMAEAGIESSARARGRTLQVLIGGLGCGYTLRAALDRAGPTARVTTAEISQAVIDWNRGPLGHLADHPLDDPRVCVERTDVAALIRRARGSYDVVLLDVDNGPQALSRTTNQWLYLPAGLQAVHRALRPTGKLVVWSAGPDARFAQRLRAAGFGVEERESLAREGTTRGARHTLFVASRIAPLAALPPARPRRWRGPQSPI
jgi:spermidine synthase